MGAAIELRADFDGATLRCLARTTKNANRSRRLLALAEIYDGARRGDGVAARLRQIEDHLRAARLRRMPGFADAANGSSDGPRRGISMSRQGPLWAESTGQRVRFTDARSSRDHR